MKIIYGLFASGNSTCDWKFKMYSKTLFLTKQEAENYIPAFIENCCDDKQLNCAERDTLKVTVVEYNLEDNSP